MARGTRLTMIIMKKSLAVSPVLNFLVLGYSGRKAFFAGFSGFKGSDGVVSTGDSGSGSSGTGSGIGAGSGSGSG